jgi:ceramide glucosyltransferase
MPADYLQQCFAAWKPDTGLVCSPPIGCAPLGFGAELECAFLNTYQARWQSFADLTGFGFAQGKTMLWHRPMLEARGGITSLSTELAEDAAATKIVREAGLRVRLVDRPFAQPLGTRRLPDVWRRQLRWARLRRYSFPAWYALELATGIVPAAVLLFAYAIGSEWRLISTVLTFVTLWYGAEAWLAWVAGWRCGVRYLACCVVRDAAIPLLWTAGWAGNEFSWHGHVMSFADRKNSA